MLRQVSLTALVLLASLFTLSAADAPIVDLGYVKYSGFQNTTAGISYYRAIPYAVPPLGNLRWRQPSPIELNNTFNGQVINASEYGPACYQGFPPYATTGSYATWLNLTQSEDCLVLNVLVPMNPVSSHLPVVVLLHGGGFVLGSPQTVAPGDAFVNASNGNVIYVEVQYRLGMFGFLAGQQIMEDGVANAGLLDQRAALNWVQQYIFAFGGDPNRVTISGGSAGGACVAYQLIAGGARDIPPFQAAIAEYPAWQPFLNASSQELQFDNVLQLSNCTDLNCMRGLSSAQLEQVNQQSYITGYGQPGYGSGDFYYGPVIDGQFIMELPDQAFKYGRFYDVPLLVDRDEYEGNIFTFPNLTTSQVLETTDARVLFPFAGQSFFSRLYQLYPASDFNSTFFQRAAWYGDFIINCPTYYMATAAVDSNTNGSAVFKMIFDAGSQLHAADVPFLWSTTTSYPDANNQTIAEILTSYFVSFAVTHDPNPLRAANAPFWPSYISGGTGDIANGESVGFTALEISNTDVGPIPDPDVNGRCDFFAGHGMDVGN